MIEKLIELQKEAGEYLNNICIGHSCDQCPYDRNGIDCDAYVKADYLIDHGVTILPCKIGDEFWTEWVGIRKVKCSMITQKADGSWKFRFTVENSGGAGVNLSLDELGKRLFATKEEAEAAFREPLKED